MTSSTTTIPIDSGEAFMSALRRDHAGLSRVLRVIDGLADRLTESPGTARPVLLDALRYLLEYHHAFHHPREDRLFARIRLRRPALDESLGRISHEHESGEREIAALVEALTAIDGHDLSGKPGANLANRINDYVRHARTHMRDEEVVFYARAESALSDADWADIIDQDGPQDPLANLAALAGAYPHLAEYLGLSTSHLGGSAIGADGQDDVHRQLLALTDVYGSLLHEGFDLTRTNLRRLLAVRGPIGLARTAGDISVDNLRFAGRCVSQPSRWAVNTGCALLLRWARLDPSR
ncbi:MAG: hemerythrin domain-containing protein [Wenzhouxiangella sp.]|nr:MAG: hemerythrin domain-containing protein [Wenzhouxiangella sp.]